MKPIRGEKDKMHEPEYLCICEVCGVAFFAYVNTDYCKQHEPKKEEK